MGLHCGSQTVAEAPRKSASPDLRSGSRCGIKAWKWDLFSTPHQKGISRVWGGKTGALFRARMNGRIISVIPPPPSSPYAPKTKSRITHVSSQSAFCGRNLKERKSPGSLPSPFPGKTWPPSCQNRWWRRLTMAGSGTQTCNKHSASV